MAMAMCLEGVGGKYLKDCQVSGAQDECEDIYTYRGVAHTLWTKLARKALESHSSLSGLA